MMAKVVKNKKQTINDEIFDVLKPKELEDPEHDEDLTAAKFSAFDELDDEEDSVKKLSDIRKRHVQDVTKTHQKYRGEVVSRAELERMDNSDETSSDDENDSEQEEVDEVNEYATDTEEENESLDEEKSENEESEEDVEDSLSEEETDDDSNEVNLIKDEAVNERVLKGKAVKSQLQLWEKLLEMRIKTQKLVSSSNSLPFGECFSGLMNISSFKESTVTTTKTVTSLLEKLRNLQSELIQRYPESCDILETNRKRRSLTGSEISSKIPRLNEIEEEISSTTNTYKAYRNEVLRKWHDRTKVAASVKSLKQMENLDIVQKINNILINKTDMIRKSQTYRGGYEIIGHSIEPEMSAEEPDMNTEVPSNKEHLIRIPEIYDDTDFYHQLLRELIEFKSSSEETPLELNQKYHELQQLRSKIKKTVDTRASKGRKIRYVVHNKLINFMAPVPNDSWSDEAKTELYNSLFDKVVQ